MNNKIMYKNIKSFVKSLLLITIIIDFHTVNSSHLTFPDDFLFGISTSAYQIEGAWDKNGKSETIWDRLVHTQSHLVADGTNGDVACDSYHKLEEDIALLKNLDVDYYRFSLSWSRILPSPLTNKINEDGIRYYNDLINLLISNKIQPLVTLYHWDLPQSLQDIGGFTNSLIIDSFIAYSKIAFENFGDRVKLWTTFNQPKVFCLHGYGGVLLAPAVNLTGIGEYLCGHNVLKAHAAVYHMYNNTFKSIQGGRLSITLDSEWYEPVSNSNEDIYAADRAMQFTTGWFAHPIFTKTGDYPFIMIETISERSKNEKFVRSRLPKFTTKEIESIKGTFDFFSLNHYRAYLAGNKQSDPVGAPLFNTDLNIEKTLHSSWPATGASEKKVTPWAFSKLLKWIKEQYGNPEIYITENGCPDFGEIEDVGRIDYLHLYLKALLKSIHEDGVRVKLYTAWSLLDNFEWTLGYTVKYGLHHVDFSSPNRTRIPKASAEYFKQVIANRKP